MQHNNIKEVVDLATKSFEADISNKDGDINRGRDIIVQIFDCFLAAELKNMCYSAVDSSVDVDAIIKMIPIAAACAVIIGSKIDDSKTNLVMVCKQIYL